MAEIFGAWYKGVPVINVVNSPNFSYWYLNLPVVQLATLQLLASDAGLGSDLSVNIGLTVVDAGVGNEISLLALTGSDIGTATEVFILLLGPSDESGVGTDSRGPRYVLADKAGAWTMTLYPLMPFPPGI